MKAFDMTFLLLAASQLIAAEQGPDFVPANFRIANVGVDLLSEARINAPVFDWNGNLLDGPEWRFELYGGRSPDALAPAQDRDARGQRAVVGLYRPGYFRDSRSRVVVDAIPNEYPAAWLQVRAWSAELGDSYEAVTRLGVGGYGESQVFKARGGYFDSTTPWPPGLLVGLESFSVRQIVPEPKAWVLMAMGGVGLWWAGRWPCRARAAAPAIQAGAGFGNQGRDAATRKRSAPWPGLSQRL